MPEKFRNRYRTDTSRLRSWDYRREGAYFITICTHKRQRFFGDIIDGKMQLSDIGEIAEEELIKTPEYRPDMNIKLEPFVVMPDHIHAIIAIGDNPFNSEQDTHHTDGALKNECTDAMHCVSTPINQFGPQPKTLGSIIRGIKSSIATNDFARWQRDQRPGVLAEVRRHRAYDIGRALVVCIERFG